MQFIKPMLPTLVHNQPKGIGWCYEVKYDGFRCQLHWENNQLRLYSRNGNDLFLTFPELKALADLLLERFNNVNIVLDGELCFLDNECRSNFEIVQSRGRLRNSDKIRIASLKYPVTYLAFDLLVMDGEEIFKLPLFKRKELLEKHFSLLQRHLPMTLRIVQTNESYEQLWKKVKEANGEGLIAKQSKSTYLPGTRSKHWLKLKNYKQINVIVTGYDKRNGYFIVGVCKGSDVITVGSFSHGMKPEEKQALMKIIDSNGEKNGNNQVVVNPSISVTLSIIGLYKGSLREPSFTRFRLNERWEDCTWENLIKSAQH
jgi:DNA ligase D-like protein (predicted ligase)